ncbi:MAG TPA: chaperone modulator CbpM [Bacteroidia bacterium]|nr:chaperone modulator CbpM [Bacteroidia bacterium]
MASENLIPVTEFCTIHQIEFSFINSLSEFGLIEIITQEKIAYIHQEQISSLEKMMRLHYDLDINLEGIDAIAHLLKRVENMNEEMTALKNKLRLYENE